MCIYEKDGYSAARKDRESTRKAQGGGVIVYIKNCINYTVRSDLMVNGIESVWIQVNRSKCKPFIVGSFYRAPDEDINESVDSFNQSLGLLNSNSEEIAILGDFNVDFSNSSCCFVSTWNIRWSNWRFLGVM